ncbi:MAG: cation acetate symporter [Akkermansiaceae bacterium]|jgi:cation/acetate symporter|nr:cation acetate symporter [Akkermansiaceae bacterium]MDP4645766.1 cation acetate symporter [Akkermansiaceae bacterium]MDP4720069.1 cation acetate symporter [Akkermansiaceae bacterium]MDP4781523.1 cation acetate symporter [Akkermansiaceae bacterium]MDP4847696.1 cation acetate symporter [Akkermansiaceae bacterium]
MSQNAWNFLFIGLSFAAYIIIAIRSRAGSTKEYYTAGGGVSPITNGMATAADWMSAATFISMAGSLAVSGYDGSRFLMGWTGGFVLLTVLMVPFLRKFGKATVPDFVGDRYYSQTARLVAVVCAIFICMTYIMGQMNGVGIVFSQLFGISLTEGVLIGSAIVFFYAGLGGMKGITYTQVAQYIVMAFAYTLPAIFIALTLTGNVIPQLGFIGNYTAGGESVPFLEKINNINAQLGFAKYTDGSLSTIDMFCITAALMCGTAGLPHVIVRFFTVKDVKAVRKSAYWTLSFIALIYLTAPTVGSFARVNLIESLHNTPYAEAPAWMKDFEKTGQMAWEDKNGDDKIQHWGPDKIAEGNENELTYGADMMVMANPYMGGTPKWVIALLMAGCIAAALSTAAGLLLVLSTAISHDLMKKIINPDLTDKEEIKWARIASFGALVVASWFGINPPSAFVAKTVAFAFGLAASSFFPTLLMGIFSKRINKQGGIAGMICGITFTLLYIVYFQFNIPFIGKGTPDQHLLGISPEGIGFVGMLINFSVAFIVSYLTPAPPQEVQDMVERIRLPNDAGEATH